MTLPSYEPRPARRKKSAVITSRVFFTRLLKRTPHSRPSRLLLGMFFAFVTYLGMQQLNEKPLKNPVNIEQFHSESSSKWNVPTVQLSSGLEMPTIGYGTCCRKSARGEQVYKSTKVYLELGGRLIDTAMAYRNHAEIGRALRDSGLERSEVWITSKVAPGKASTYNACLAAIDEILNELGTTYLDLLLIHTPKLGKHPTIELWKCLIEAKRIRKTNTIGVSNFNRGEIEDVNDATGYMPEANEIQMHPWSSPSWRALATWQRKNNIATIAYTSLGGSRFDSTQFSSAWPSEITKLANKYDVTEAQILLKWALQNGLAIIPGSGSKKHIRENLLINVKFDLSDDEIKSIERSKTPHGWWDIVRGHQKYTDDEAGLPWAKRKNG